MYVWSEAESGKGSRQVCNVLYQHIKELKLEKAIYWCDSTVSQNRNSIIANFFVWAVNHIDHLKTVYLRFLQTGHSFNSGDRDFGLIKKRLGVEQNVFTIEKYLTIIKEARRNPSPFNVTHIDQFYEFDKGTELILPNTSGIRTTEGEKVRWFNVRELKFTESLVGCHVKYDFRSESVYTVDFETRRLKRRIDQE